MDLKVLVRLLRERHLMYNILLGLRSLKFCNPYNGNNEEENHVISDQDCRRATTNFSPGREEKGE